MVSLVKLISCFSFQMLSLQTLINLKAKRVCKSNEELKGSSALR